MSWLTKNSNAWQDKNVVNWFVRELSNWFRDRLGTVWDDTTYHWDDPLATWDEGAGKSPWYSDNQQDWYNKN